MSWHRLLKRYGVETNESAQYDPFQLLASTATDASKATVAVSVGSKADYGQISCQVTVTISCPQAEPAINMAGELAFRKALELANDGAGQIGAPALPPFEEP